MGADNAKTVLRGTTLEVYRYLLKSGKPTGTREIQRILNLSSPSLAAYHLSKLEDAGLLKKENGNYVIDKVILEDTVKVNRYFIPRYLFYAIFAIVALVIELTVLWPPTITSEYFFSTTVTATCAVAFSFETVKKWSKGGF